MLIPHGEGGRWFDTNLNCVAPWYTTPCLEWLMTLDLKDKRVFEFGVGDSTLWYRSQGAITSGVDSNYSWASKVCAWHGENEEHYLQSISVLAQEVQRHRYQTPQPLTKELFDIVINDGDYRDKCTEQALNNLKPGGYLIIDNFLQPSVQEFWPLTDKLIEGMPITIYKEPSHYDWVTAVITKS